jgi:hypothetical protein
LGFRSTSPKAGHPLLCFRFVAGTVSRSGRRLVLRLQAGYPLLADFVRALARLCALARAPA